MSQSKESPETGESNTALRSCRYDSCRQLVGERNINDLKKIRLRKKERTEDALALGAEEGRDEQRNAAGSRK